MLFLFNIQLRNKYDDDDDDDDDDDEDLSQAIFDKQLKLLNNKSYFYTNTYLLFNIHTTELFGTRRK